MQNFILDNTLIDEIKAIILSYLKGEQIIEIIQNESAKSTNILLITGKTKALP